MGYSLADLVDLERYPIDDLNGRGAGLVASCIRAIRETAICHLPGFVRAEAIDIIRDEALAQHPRTYWNSGQRRAYSWRDPAEHPPGHPVGMSTPNSIGTITTDAFTTDSAFVSLFNLPELTAFLRAALNEPDLHPVACPYLAANIKVMRQGCQHAWHFDQNVSAVTFMIQNARRGGHYEYVPFLRDEDDENYDRVGQLLSGDPTGVKREPLLPGSFCLFRGRRSIHRVTEVVEGDPDRLLAVFSYHTVENHRYRDSTMHAVLGRLPDGYVARS
ncbi:MAG: hypothetical protein KDK91_05035 [Gammaproteobacteria bacterium]|nr:hypothetical protein [Gammaproteobacteria bacterium]